MDELHREWGQNIRRLRRWHDLTQTQLAEKLGVTRNAVAQWEAGTRAPLDKHKRLLAGILNQDVRQLFPLTRIEQPEAAAS